MRHLLGSLAFSLIVCASLAAQTPAPAPQSATAPAANPNNVRITSGPKVEFAGADRAVVAWSTNVASGTVVRYGLDPNNLSDQAKMPWGSLTHRVTLKRLQPNTEYYFQVQSGDAAGTGTSTESGIDHFQTKAAAQQQPSTTSPR